MILLYLIKCRSTFRVPIYQVLLAVDAGLDLLLSTVVLIGQPIGLTGDGYFVLLTNGFFAHSSPTFDSLMMFLFAFVLHMNVLWIPIQFACRYILLCRRQDRQTSRKLTYTVMGIAAVWNLVALGVIYTMIRPRPEFQEYGVQVLKKNNWPFPVHSPPPVVGAYLTDIRLFAWEILWFISSGGGAVVAVLCEMKIVKHFRVLGDAYHERTRQMHREFHRALLAMAICPLITSGIPIFFFIVTIGFSLCPGPISAFMTTGTTCITMFNPLTTILFIRCYRETLLRCFRKRPVCTSQTTAVTVLEGTASSQPTA